MELTVAKADLQKELQLCQGIVEKRSTIPILSNVLLRAADGRLQIAATDLDVTILSSCAARITTSAGVTIEAKRLFDIVRSLPDEDVHITLQETTHSSSTPALPSSASSDFPPRTTRHCRR